ncbi:MAG: glycosyltransferase family 9 protein [Opitutales bacterium]
MSGNRALPKKAVVLRTGGLGDFVLTVPLLVSMVEAGVRVTVATRRSYFEILGELCANLSFIDAEELFVSDKPNVRPENFSGATVFSFWKDSDGSLEARLKTFGIHDLVELESRPSTSPHMVKRIFQDTGIQWEEKLYKRSWLRVNELEGDCLWVHPGSGSPVKNLPLSWFVKRIERWLADGGDKVVVSFGEADLELEKKFRSIGGNMPLDFIYSPTLLRFRDELISKASLFVGNDSGPAHLAAALGIPTEVVFLQTNPDIWRPLGESVKVLRSRELNQSVF